MARIGCEHQGPTILLTCARAGAHASLPCDGSSRLTHTLSRCSAVCAPLSRTPYYTVTRGFTRATDFLCPFTYTYTTLVRYLERKRLCLGTEYDPSRPYVKRTENLFYSENYN